MIKKIMFGLLAIIMLSVFVNASSNDYSRPNLQIKLFNYDPILVNPGSYFTAWIKIINNGTGTADNVQTKLTLNYPFSLDSEETEVKSLGIILVGQESLARYRINVKKDASDGDRNITIGYSNNGAYNEQNFTIRVAKVQTDFDITVQDASTDLITVGISNIGKNTANSIVLKTTGIIENSYAIGTMNANNYTIIQVPVKLSDVSQTNQLNVEISYTDLNGNRQTLNKQVVINNIQTSVDFDAIIQDVSTEGISLGIANVGKNIANSVTVRTEGARRASFLLGNLNAGDYSVVVIPTNGNVSTLNANSTSFKRNQTTQGNLTPQNRNTLKVNISYTTINGYRKTVTKEVSLDSISSTRNRIITTAPTTSNTDWWFYTTILLAAIIAYGFYSRKKNE